MEKIRTNVIEASELENYSLRSQVYFDAILDLRNTIQRMEAIPEGELSVHRMVEGIKAHGDGFGMLLGLKSLSEARIAVGLFSEEEAWKRKKVDSLLSSLRKYVSLLETREKTLRGLEQEVRELEDKFLDEAGFTELNSHDWGWEPGQYGDGESGWQWPDGSFTIERPIFPKK